MSALLEKTVLDPVELKRQFEQDGYVLLRNILSDHAIQQLRNILLGVFEERRVTVFDKSEASKKYPYQDVLTDIFVNYPELLGAVCHPVIVEALTVILGPDFVLTPETSALRDVYTTLHTDTTTCEMKGNTFHKQSDFLMITLSVYLQDNIRETAGGLFIVPGSHKQKDYCVTVRRNKLKERKTRFRSLKKILRKISGDRWFNYERQLMENSKGQDIPSKIGDVIIFNSRCVHRASFPQSQNFSGDGSKLAIYGMFMKNNQHVQNHIDFLKSRTDTPAYDYLHAPRATETMAALCKQYGFTAL